MSDPRAETRARLREAAEARVARGADAPSESTDLARIAHELQVHQVEVEMQHEQLRRAEMELADSRNRYRALYELTPVAHVTLDETGTVMEANRAACVLLGMDSDELVGRPLSAFMTQGAADAFHHHRKETFGSRSTQACEVELLRTRDTSSVPVRLISNRICDEGEEPRAITALFDRREVLDVQDKLQAQRQRSARQVREGQQEQLRRIAEHIDDVLYEREAVEGGFTYVSPAVERVWGLPPAELRRDAGLWMACIHPDDRARIARAQALFAAGDPFDAEYRLCLAEGEVRFVRERAFVVERHGASRVVGIATDVTEERKLEEELERAQKMETIGNLAGGIAHDFNNLLQAILGCAQMALDSRTDAAEAQDYVHRIAEAAKRGAGLTSQLMSLSRREAANVRPVPIDATLQATAALLERLLGEDIAVTIDLGCGEAAVLAAAVQLEQVLLNLASNARDAMPEGGRFSLSSTRVEHGGSDAPRIRLTVADTGCGMEPALLGRIFEPFYTTKPTGKGTGLGLASVQAIVRRLGGHVAVDSVPGRGTTFTIELPQCEALPEPPAAALPEGRKLDGIALVVEDQPLVRLSVAHYLSDLGLHVFEASGPEDALTVVDRLPARLDVLVSDVMMPGMSGPRLAQRLRARYPGLPAVFMSAYAEAELVAMGTVESGTEVLQKPFDRETLRARLTLLLPTRVASSHPPPVPAGAIPVVLLVEDDAAACLALEELLPQEGYEVWSASSAEAALERIEREGRGPDLLLTDASLPGMSGLELISVLEATEPPPRVVLMSGLDQLEVPDVSLLPKPVDLVELLQTVARQLSR